MSRYRLRTSCQPGEVRDPVARVIIYLILIGISFLFIMPFFWQISTAFKKPGAVFLIPIQWIPKEPTFNNFYRLFIEYGFQKYIYNSVWLTAINLIGYLSSCTLVAYAFATQRWKYKNQLFILVLATMMLPREVIFYPRFILFVHLNLYGTMAPLWAPSFFADAFQVFLLRQFFLGVPTELGEAAKIDGCSRFRIFWNIYLPLSKAALATSAIYIFMYHWNDFFAPLIYITREEWRTSALALMYLLNALEMQSTIPVQMAAAIITVIPCLVLYYFCQQYFVAGLVNKGVEK